MKPDMEVLVKNREGRMFKVFAKKLSITNEASPKRAPKFEDPDGDGNGYVRGKIKVDIANFRGSYTFVEALVDADRFFLFEGNAL